MKGLLLFSILCFIVPAAAQSAPAEKDGFESIFRVLINNPDPGRAAAAEDELKRLAATGNPLAQFYYGHLLVQASEGNDEEAYRLLARAYPKVAAMAHEGNATAGYMVTYSYSYGYATPLNKRRAFKLRLQLAERSYAPAAYAVGLAYLDGDGVKTDADKAAYWLARAAQGGLSIAAWSLGEAYLFGKGVQQNYQLAYYWYSVAAENGDRYAARVREEIKPRLTRRDLLASYRMLTVGEGDYPPGKYNWRQRLLMAVGIMLPWFKFVLLDQYIWADAAAFGLAALLLSWAMAAWRRRRFLADIPLMNIKDVFIGWVHVRGLVHADDPLISYLAGEPCVYYAWSVTEDWERRTMEEYVDRDGKKKLREKIERGSAIVASGGDREIFDLVDQTGGVKVSPEGADLETVPSFSRSCGPDDDLYFGMCPAPEVNDTLHVRHFNESVLPVGVNSTIFGQACAHGGGLVIERAADTPFYIISLSDAASQRKSWLSAIRWLAALSLAAVITFPMVRLFFLEDKPGLAGFSFICLLAYALMFFAFWFMMAFNGVVFLHNRVGQIKAVIDVQLKRRADLLPRLAGATRGIGAYEKAVLTRLAELRGYGGRPVYKDLLALAEAYPALGAAAAYGTLMESLRESEDKIAGARGNYFNAAAAYNTRLQRLPDRLLLKLGLFKPAPVEDFSF